jgi:hypothetical protein
MILAFGLFEALIRLGLYWSGVAPPFSFYSRILYARLIVPGFDQIFLTPLITIAVAVIGGTVAAHSGSWYPAAHAIFLALICFILFAGGPTMRNWVLTGEHRFRPRITGGSSRQAFRPI